MILSFWLGILIIALDRGIKLMLSRFWPDLLVRNQGIIFGHQNLSNRLLYLIFGLLLVLSFIIIKKPQRDEKFSFLGITLVLGGVISNLLDRLLKGAVLDYFKLGNLFFNLADIAIIMGLIIYIKQSLCPKHIK